MPTQQERSLPSRIQRQDVLTFSLLLSRPLENIRVWTGTKKYVVSFDECFTERRLMGTHYNSSIVRLGLLSASRQSSERSDCAGGPVQINCGVPNTRFGPRLSDPWKRGRSAFRKAISVLQAIDILY